MGYWQRLRVRKSADDRVLKSQLDFIADGIYASRFKTPVWTVAIALVASDRFGYLGHTPLAVALILPAAVTAVLFVTVHLIKLYRGEAAGSIGSERLHAWQLRFIAVQVMMSTAWATMPWLLWTPGDHANHLFLACWIIGMIGRLVINRSNRMDVVLAGLLPLTIISALRFVSGGSLFDFEIAAFMVFLACQFFSCGRRLSQRLDDDKRLRFEVEDLAREVEEARDEALRKRFEAEAANASKTAFLANMSHELRTPLNAILGFSEIIAKECFGAVGSPRYKEYAGDIHSSGSHLLSLINDLLDVAKIEAGRMDIEPKVLDVRRTFEAALKILGIKARERLQELVIDVDPSAPSLFADERAVKQILINLVSNAVKFTPEGGRIAVLGTRARCGSFQIVVEDNGPGIPREKLDKIFKPFSQVDNRYDRQAGGTGLGLALVRGLSELHGGRAWLESEAGKGCRAFVILPTAGAVTEPAAA